MKIINNYSFLVFFVTFLQVSCQDQEFNVLLKTKLKLDKQIKKVQEHIRKNNEKAANLLKNKAVMQEDLNNINLELEEEAMKFKLFGYFTEDLVIKLS